MGEAEQDWLREHLGGCTACASYAELTARIVRGFQSFSLETDPGMNARVRETVTRRAMQPQAQHVGSSTRPRRWLFAAAGLLLLAGIPIYRNLRERRPESETDRADAILVERVSERVAREVPVAMEPLMLTPEGGKTR
jgi:hypothetical protein